MGTPAGALATLQHTAGNRAAGIVVARLLAQRQTTKELDDKYHTAVFAGNWQQAAVLLNGFNDVDIQTRVNALESNQVEAMKQACPAWAWRVRAPLLDVQFQAAVVAGKWDRAAIYLNGFNDDDIRARLKKLDHAQHIHLYYGARNGLQGASQQRITFWLGTVGEFTNKVSQDMTEGVTTVVQGRFIWTLIDGQLEVWVQVKFAPDPGIAVPLAAWQSQIDKVWNRFAVVEPGGRKVPVTMHLQNVASVARTIKVVQNVVPGQYGCNADRSSCDRANAGKWYPKMPDDTAPHEFGHLIGLPDEYQRTHADFAAITGGAKAGPLNSSGKTPLAIAKELHASLYLDDESKRAAAATAVLTSCGLVVAGTPQQGDFAQSVMKAYDGEYGGVFTKYLLEALRSKIPENQRWTLLSVFSYASGTIMGNPQVVGAGHDHPVEDRHLREFRDIVARVWPAYAWTIGPR